MKKILFLFLFVCSIFIPKEVYAYDTVDPTSNFYVNDYANILSNETENYIMENSVSLASQTSAQIVVVTVPNLDGASLEEYATRLFREFGIGDKKENNGLLLLLALEEREMRVEVGYGLEGILPDGKTGRFQDEYMIPFFREDNFDEGMLNGYKAFFQEVANYYEYDGIIDGPIEEENNSIFPYIFIIIVILIDIILVIKHRDKLKGETIFSIMSSRSSFGSSGGSSGGFSGGGGRSGGGGSSRRF